MNDPSSRFHRSDSTIGSCLMAIVGLGMTLGFGALFVGSLLDLRAFPDAPRPITVAAAAAVRDPPRGSWVRLVDARFDCRFPTRSTATGRGFYGVVTDVTRIPRIVVGIGFARAHCDPGAVVPIEGVLGTSSPGRIVGLDWPGLDWNEWPTPHMNTLWTESGPSDSRIGLWLGPLLMLPGLLILFGLALSVRDSLRRGRPPRPALPDAPISMPLSTGASALSVMSIPIGVFQWLAFGPLFIATRLPGWTVYPLGILWAVWFFAVIGSLMEGWKRRASDLLMTPDQLAVRGGPLHRTVCAWRDLDPARCQIVEATEGSAEALDATTTLMLDGETAAVTSDPDEIRSFRAVAATLRSLHAQALGERLPEPPNGPPGMVRCEQCGAPVAPTAAAVAKCSYCRSDVAIPEEMHEQLRALEQLGNARVTSEQLVRRLLRQPGARATSLMFAIAVPPLLLGWPAAAIIFDEFYQTRHLFDWRHGVALFVAALCFTYGLSWLVRAQVVGRVALRLIATRFAAVPARVPGGPMQCHRCAGPLPVASAEQLVAICLYCHSENVLGVQLTPVARREDEQALDLRNELQSRLAQRRRYRLVSLASLLLLGASFAALAPAWTRMQQPRVLVRRPSTR